MRRAIVLGVMILAGCVTGRGHLFLQAVDIKNTSQTPEIYTINIVFRGKAFPVVMPFNVEYLGRWGIVSNTKFLENIAIDVSNTILLFPYAQYNDWLRFDLPSLRFCGSLLVPADYPDEKQGLVCVSKKDPGVQVPELMTSNVNLYEAPADFWLGKDHYGKTTAVIRMVLWPNSNARFTVNADCEIHIASVSTDSSLIAAHEGFLRKRLGRQKIEAQ